MSNRKKILAVILFLLFGTTIYTFANPADKDEVVNDANKEVVEPTPTPTPTATVDNQETAIVNDNLDEQFNLLLLNAKNAAIDELNLYAKEINYDTNNWILVNLEITKGVAAINASTTLEEVATALQNAKNEIDKIDTILKQLQDAKDKAIKELREYVKETDYTVANWAVVQFEITNGINLINNATKIEEISLIVKDTKLLIDKVDTILKQLQDFKDKAKIVVKNHIDTSKVKYREAQLLEIKNIIDKALIDIDSATSIEAVIIIRDKALLDLDKVKTDSQLYIEETRLVTFLDYDSNVLLSSRIYVGEDAVAPEVQSEFTIKNVVYTFNSWDTDYKNIQNDLTIKPVYNITSITSSITLLENDTTTDLGNILLDINNTELSAAINSNNNVVVATLNISNYLLPLQILPILNDNETFMKYEYYELSYTSNGFNIKVRKVLDTEALLNYRNLVISNLEQYKTNLNFTNSYIEEANKIVSDAVSLINTSLTKTNIDLIYSETIKKLDSLSLKEYKELAIQRLDSYRKSLDFSNYYIDSAKKIVSDATVAINASTTKANVDSIYNEAKSNLDTAISKLAVATLVGNKEIVLQRESLYQSMFDKKTYTDQGINSIISNSNYVLSTVITFSRPYTNDSKVVDKVDLSYGSKVGTYTITYTIKNAAGSFTLTRTVVVNRLLDEILANNDISIDFSDNDSYQACATIYCSAPIVNLSATAKDHVDGNMFTATDISNRIKIVSNNVNTKVVETYQVVYSVTDWTGLEYQKTRTIKIIDTIAPTINLSSEMQTISINGYSVVVPKATATDNYDSNLIVNISTTNYEQDFDYTKEGSGILNTKYYKQEFVTGVTYTVIDSNNNKTTVKYTLPSKVAVSNKIKILYVEYAAGKLIWD